MGDCIGHNEAEKKENMDNPVVIYVCKNHDYVVVDVQFQGHETEYEIIQEQFEFELVGSRIHVRPCAPDHPQGAGYSDHPRKRPASPPNDDPCEVFRAVKPKIKQERQTRSAKARSPSPSRRSLVEKQIIRCRDRSTSPCVTRKMRHEDCDERFPLTRRRPQRVNMKSEDSNTSFSSYPPARRQQRPIKKESSMWIISKRVPDNYSMDSNNSLGDVNNGSFQYSVQHDDDGNYSFTERSKNIDRMKRGSRNLAVQAGYDEDLCLKRLKQFCEGRHYNGKLQRNQPGRRNTVGPRCDMCNSALNDREPRSNMKQYRPSKEKRCSFSCHQCCSDEISPSVVFEEYEMFASTETIKRDTHIYDEEDEEEDKRKNDENKKSKGTGKNVKKEPSKEPEEVKGSKNKVQNSKKKDKNKQVEKQKSKTGRTSKSPTIKVEKSEDETEDDTKEEALLKDVSLHHKNIAGSTKNKEGRPSIARSKSNLSPDSAKIKEEKKEERVISAKSKNRLSPESAKKQEEKKDEKKYSTQSKSRLSPENMNKKEEKEEEKETNLSMVRNCCRKSLMYRRKF